MLQPMPMLLVMVRGRLHLTIRPRPKKLKARPPGAVARLTREVLKHLSIRCYRPQTSWRVLLAMTRLKALTGSVGPQLTGLGLWLNRFLMCLADLLLVLLGSLWLCSTEHTCRTA